jgi:DNA-directed RNA polymerase subunit M/transcription elongation factor TFIIS
MLWLKSCSKCHGDLHPDSDVYGSYIACVQCGRQLTVAEEAILMRTQHMAAATAVAERPTKRAVA